ncbi:MAG: UDP-N-acetylmuramoyl-tripeptide--D-alanyl-D-alanine ligase, partial [Candidatus Gastranaerophilales bacterium]|nr:UDP-N-acetylmuramoyl-tripeptide--D-alanyl-D-alanine ligase [Candidatus Gastranaerophilales bacterium]
MFKPKFTLEELIKITNGEYTGNIKKDTSFSISTDTRTITKDDAYLAICGANFDGHNFVQNAFQPGANLAIIDKNHSSLKNEIKGNFLIVENTLCAYLSIAKFHKDRCNTKIIAVTGSSGKTTTKEFLYSVFNAKYKTQKSIKNHNNEIGLCQTLLSIEPDTKYCIVEMGMRARGEIDLLAKYARPNIAVITNVGNAHIGILGSRENIAKAKCEITNYLTEQDLLIAHNEELIKNTLTGNYNKIFYDLDEVKIIEKSENLCKFKYNDFIFEITDSADFNILNALASIKAAKIENYTNEEIQKGLNEFQNVEFR